MDPKEVREMVGMEEDSDGATHQVAVIMTGEIYRNAGLKNSKHSDVEGRLYDKLCQIGKHKLRDEVRLMAKNIALQVSDKEFVASVSWLDDFSRRFCLSRKKMGFHSASMLKTKGTSNKVVPKVKGSADTNKKTTENGHANNDSESNKSPKNINGENTNKDEVIAVEDPDEDPLMINSDEAKEADPLDTGNKADSESKSADSESKSADSESKSADSESKSADSESKSADSESKSADSENKSADSENKSADSENKSDTNIIEEKPRPLIRVRKGLEIVQNKSETEDDDIEEIEVEKKKEKDDTDSSNGSKKGKKGENTSNEGESDGGSSDEETEKEIIELSDNDNEDKENESNEDKKDESKEKKKVDKDEILIDYSKEESKYWRKNFETLEKKVNEEVFRCSSCNEQVNHQIRGLVKAHPVLGVFLCKRCRKFYGKGRFCKDDEGYDEYCRWCAEGGDLLCCEQEGCFNGFCKRCIKRNLGRSEASKAENADNWECYVCDKAPLTEPRAILRTIIYCIDKAEQKADKMSRTDHKKKDMTSKFELLKRNRLKKAAEKNKKEKEKERKDKKKKEPQNEEDYKAGLLSSLSEGANRGEPWLQDSIDSMGDMIQICHENLKKIDQRWKKESCSAEATVKAVERMLKQIRAMSTNFNIMEEHLTKSNEGTGDADMSTNNIDGTVEDDQQVNESQSKKKTKDQQKKEKENNEDEEELSTKSPRKGRKTIIESDDDDDDEEKDDEEKDEEVEAKINPKKGKNKKDETDSSEDEVGKDTTSKSEKKKSVYKREN